MGCFWESKNLCCSIGGNCRIESYCCCCCSCSNGENCRCTCRCGLSTSSNSCKTPRSSRLRKTSTRIRRNFGISEQQLATLFTPDAKDARIIGITPVRDLTRIHFPPSNQRFLNQVG